MQISSAAISVAARLRSDNFFFVRPVSCIRRQKRAFIFARRRRRRGPACTACAAILPPKKRFERCFSFNGSSATPCACGMKLPAFAERLGLLRGLHGISLMVLFPYSQVGMATLTFLRLTRWAGFGAVAATVSVVALRNAAVILDHAVTIGVSAILFGHTNTLFLS